MPQLGIFELLVILAVCVGFFSMTALLPKAIADFIKSIKKYL